MSMLLEVSELAFSLAEKNLLTNISFSVYQGECWALIGKNGAGKTTLLNCLTGYYTKTFGEIKWKGNKIETIKGKDLAKIVSYCATAPQPFYSCTVLDMILFGRSSSADFWGNYSENDLALAHKYSEMFELNNLLDRNYANISLGERQRVNLAMTMVAETEVLLLDEPTSHLDPYHQKKLISNLKKMCSKNKMAVLAVVHDIAHATFFDKVMIIGQNTITMTGSPNEILVDKNLNRIFGKNVFRTIAHKDKKITCLNL